MARMVPFPMLPTDSAAERRLYEGFLEQLDEAFVVYHSVDWVLAGRHGPDEGEADFVIAHPELGMLALEAKGGRLDYDPATRRWTQTGHSGTHVLDEDPFHQAQGAPCTLSCGSWKPGLGGSDGGRATGSVSRCPTGGTRRRRIRVLRSRS